MNHLSIKPISLLTVMAALLSNFAIGDVSVTTIYNLGYNDSFTFWRAKECKSVSKPSMEVSERLLSFELLRDQAKGKPKAEAYLNGSDKGIAEAQAMQAQGTLCDDGRANFSELSASDKFDLITNGLVKTNEPKFQNTQEQAPTACKWPFLSFFRGTSEGWDPASMDRSCTH